MIISGRDFNIAISTKNKKLRKYIIANNNIRADKVRLIDNEGTQLGVVSLREALIKANEAGLDLIKVTDKVQPPVCKIMDYGKYAYQLGKKEKKQKQKSNELKNIRLTFNISPHDMETRAKAAEKFLAKEHKVRVEMRLRGRQKALAEHARDKTKQFLELVNKTIPIKIERELKKEPRGFTIIIGKVSKKLE